MAYTTIDDPSVYFQTALYTGSDDASATKVVTNDGNSDLQPDLLWFKRRNGSANHAWQDTSRGIGNGIASSTTGAEVNDDYGVTAIGSDGFSVRENAQAAGEINQGSMVCWQWKANGGTATATISESGNNPAAVVQANPTAGFSIITYTGTGASGTIAHGLGARPKFIMIKNRDAGEGWHINGELITGNTNGGFHFNTDAEYTGGSNNSTASSIDANNIHVISSGNINTNGQKYVAYVFAPIQGYSKFGTYVGNNNADGTFIYLGFKPAWVMLKRTDSAASWLMFDDKRDIDNVVSHRVYANGSYAEDSDTGSAIDFLSNGFKCRSSDSSTNTSSGTYIYMAFAENPFVSSKGVPTTAR